VTRDDRSRCGRRLTGRRFLARLAALLFTGLLPAMPEAGGPLKLMLKSAWGSDDPTRCLVGDV